MELTQHVMDAHKRDSVIAFKCWAKRTVEVCHTIDTAVEGRLQQFL